MTLCLFLLGLPAWAAPPAWDAEAALDLNGLSLQMTEEEVVSSLGDPTKVLDEQLKLYSGNLLVRTREGRVVNLSAFDQGGHWALGVAGRPTLRTGSPEAGLRAGLGAPWRTFVNSEKDLQALLYVSIRSDLVVLLQHGQVAALMLAEPGTLAQSLLSLGYEVQEAAE
jgi:hypothetical protein